MSEYVTATKPQQKQGMEEGTIRTTSLHDQRSSTLPAQLKDQRTAGSMPRQLAHDIKAFSGASMEDVRVHSNTPQPVQMQTTPTFQLQSRVFSQQDQMYSYITPAGQKKQINVGSFMEVGLDPDNMPQGQSANLNTSQDELMDSIRNRWGIIGGGIVKGHLWNDNLGGSAMNYNLYPITKAANSDHLGYVENKAKEYIWNKQPIYYKVEVDADPNITSPQAELDCEIRQWDPHTNALGSLLFGPVTIASDLNDVGAYNEAYETYTGNPADRQKRPKAPKWATNPKTKVGELTKQEIAERNGQ